ncbi:MAG: hypothetical protein M3255_02655 [Pseudomonadota bacterium]|nr:hypothetical protein [Pseudomonadota bacterium]
MTVDGAGPSSDQRPAQQLERLRWQSRAHDAPYVVVKVDAMGEGKVGSPRWGVAPWTAKLSDFEAAVIRRHVALAIAEAVIGILSLLFIGSNAVNRPFMAVLRKEENRPP